MSRKYTHINNCTERPAAVVLHPGGAGFSRF